VHGRPQRRKLLHHRAPAHRAPAPHSKPFDGIVQC
jgi:hypothetical protein